MIRFVASSLTSLPLFFLTPAHYLYFGLWLISMLLIKTISFRSGSIFYSALGLFFILGYTIKIGAHIIFDYPYIEPL